MNNAARDFRSNLIAAGVHLDTVNLTARVCLEGREHVGRGAVSPFFLGEGPVRPKSSIPRKHIYGDHALYSFRDLPDYPQRLAEARAKHEMLPRGESLDPTIDWQPVIDPYAFDPLPDINQEVREDGLLMTGRRELEKDLEGDTLNAHDDALRERLNKQPVTKTQFERQMPVRAYGETELSERNFLRLGGRRIDQQTIEAILNAPQLAKKETQRICDAITEIGQRSWSFMAEANKKNSATLRRHFKKALGHNRHNRRFANNPNKPKRQRQAWQ